MKTITLTKSEIQQALATENLIAGKFFEQIPFKTALGKNCKVCAVGAVLRGHFEKLSFSLATDLACLVVDDQYLSDTSDYKILKKDVNSALKVKNYLGALSMYHEALCEEADTGKGSYIYSERTANYASSDEHRFYLIDFVEAHFPKVIKIELESSYDLG